MIGVKAMADRTVTLNVMGTNVEVDKYKDCPRCNKVDGCYWQGVAYSLVCDECYGKDEYQTELGKKDKESRKYTGMQDALDVNKPTAVWNFKDQAIYTNKKGDMIKQEKSRPLKTGREKD